jgi:hypothetical protein
MGRRDGRLRIGNDAPAVLSGSEAEDAGALRLVFDDGGEGDGMGHGGFDIVSAAGERLKLHGAWRIERSEQRELNATAEYDLKGKEVVGGITQGGVKATCGLGGYGEAKAKGGGDDVVPTRRHERGALASSSALKKLQKHAPCLSIPRRR